MKDRRTESHIWSPDTRRGKSCSASAPDCCSFPLNAHTGQWQYGCLALPQTSEERYCVSRCNLALELDLISSTSAATVILPTACKREWKLWEIKEQANRKKIRNKATFVLLLTYALIWEMLVQKDAAHGALKPSSPSAFIPLLCSTPASAAPRSISPTGEPKTHVHQVTATPQTRTLTKEPERITEDQLASARRQIAKGNYGGNPEQRDQTEKQLSKAPACSSGGFLPSGYFVDKGCRASQPARHEAARG